MVKANELRIGNILIEDNGDYTEEFIIASVNSLTMTVIDINDYTISIEFLKPIPLTEEWLLKFGFKSSETFDEFFILDNIYAISIADNKYKFISGNSVCQIVLCELNNVHHLQNLYFVLTGKELTLNK